MTKRDRCRRAAAYLQARATKLGSQYLFVMASHTAQDPFAKVKKMIKDLLVRLLEEAGEEENHHAYCTSELATNKQTRTDKAAEAEKLAAEVDSLTTEIAQLKGDVQELSDAISEIMGKKAEGQRMRDTEKANNQQTVADAKAAQVAIERAMKVLRDFYAQAEDDSPGGASLLQASGGADSDRTEAAEREPYTGMQGAKAGVLGALEVLVSDFARLETETSAAEDQAATAFQTFLYEAEEDVEVKRTEVKHKEERAQEAAEALRSAKTGLAFTQEELDRALDYYDTLKAECLDKGLSYEERVKRREEEIQSLKEALRILDGEALG